MTELFYSFFNSINLFLGAGWLFIISLSIIILLFFINFLKAKRQEDYPLKKRFIYLIEVFSVCTLERAFSILCNHSFGFSLLSFAIGMFLFAPILSAKKRVKSREKERNFIKYIDDCLLNKNSAVKEFFEKNDIEKQTRVENFDYVSPKKEENSVIDENEKQEQYSYSLDFTHVKNVIARLENLSLGASDKRQVRELESAMLEAEKGNISPNLKEKINDGLGALLKIMARYGA